jgi:uncharacterized membrane protein YeaQ/YmgE (transglycosylase-associated protein family)
MALFLLVPCVTAGAQTLTPGTRVRVKSSQMVAPVIGNYQGMRRDTVVVIEEGLGAQVWTFTSSAVDRIEVSAGMKGGNRGPTTRWALIGAGAGAVTGIIVATILESSSSSQYNNLLSGVVGAGIGGAIGAAYGYRKFEEHWTPVAVPRRVGIVPTRDGLRIGLSATF